MSWAIYQLGTENASTSLFRGSILTSYICHVAVGYYETLIITNARYAIEPYPYGQSRHGGKWSGASHGDL